MNQRQYFNELAPRWDSLGSEEDRVRLARIIGEVGIGSSQSVLDVGSGTGALVPLLRETIGNGGRIVSLDISEKMLQLARGKGFAENTHFVQADAGVAPMVGEAFDLVMCHSVFPHFQDKPGTLAELKRILQIEGRLIICHTKSRHQINAIHQNIGGAVGHDMLPDETEMRVLLAKAGFERIEVRDEPEGYLAIAHKGDGTLSPDMEIACRMLNENRLSFAIVKNGEVLASSPSHGVRPFFEVVTNLGQAIEGAALADRVVGKAVAMLCIYAKINATYAPLASKPALEALGGAHISTNAVQVVSAILDRSGKVVCPLEELLQGVRDPAEAYEAIENWMRRCYGGESKTQTSVESLD